MERWKRWRNERAVKRAVNEAEDFVRREVPIRSITTLSANLETHGTLSFSRKEPELEQPKYGTSVHSIIVKGELVDNEGNRRRWEVDFEGGKLDSSSIDKPPMKSGSTKLPRIRYRKSNAPGDP